MPRIFIPIFYIFVVSLANSLSAQTASTYDELRQFADLSLLPQYRDNTKMQEVSTYDRTGGNDDGFSGKYSFIRRNGDSSIVIFEAKGPGVINRIWTPTPTDDTLDFYLDDSLFSIKYSDLFSGKVKPFVAPLCGSELGGNYCYYPMLFQDSCKIVCRAKKLQFHQIQWRSYPAGTKVVRSFPDAAIANGIPHVDVSRLKKFSVASGNAVLIFESNAGGRVEELNVYPASLFSGNAKDIWINIICDGEKEPAVDCPLADFFGFAFGKPSMQSWLLGTKDNVAYCRLPMPYDRNCRIKMINRGRQAITFSASVKGSTVKRDPSREGKFYSSYSYRRYNGHDGPHQLLQVNGRGHFIGTVLQAQGTKPGMTIFFEGDDSTVVDGELALHGTGSEDYFNGGWYAYPDRWDAAFSLPFHGSLDYSIPFCRTGAYRFYLSDKIPFEKSFFHSIEHGPEDNNVPAIYTSLAFYYGDHPPVNQPVKETPSVYIPDTLMIYPHLNNFMFWSGVTTKSMGLHDTGGLSILYTVNDESRIRFSLEDIPDGKYELFMDFDRVPTGAEVSIYQRQTLIRNGIDGYATANTRVPSEKIGEIEITPFKKTLTLQFKTTAQKNEFLLNRFIIARKR
jgi:hypothetical protein